MFYKGKDACLTPCGPGVTRRVLAYADDLMLCEVTFTKGATGSLHAHPHTQASYIVSGRFEFTVADEKNLVSRGDSILVPGNAQHSVLALEDGVILDAFTPMRKDFV